MMASEEMMVVRYLIFASRTKYQFKCGDWKVERSYSNWDNSCIKGDQPVSLRRFLKAIGVDSAAGLRQLGSDIINVDFIASRM